MENDQMEKVDREHALRQLRLLQSARRQRELSSNISEIGVAYLKAASVLSTFDPGLLIPVGHPRNPGEAAQHLMPLSKAITSNRSQSHWRLTSRARHLGLSKFSNPSQMRKATQLNPQRQFDAIQWAIEQLLSGEVVKFGSLPVDRLAGLSTAVDWFSPFISGLREAYPEQALRAATERAKLFSPLRELIGNDFVGRTNELRHMTQYVGVLPSKSVVLALQAFFADLWHSLNDHPPLFIHGPGGIGKSALIAKFILDHSEVDDGKVLPIVYLDADRPGIVADQPMSLLIEAAQQIGAQFPDVQADAHMFAEDLTLVLGRTDTEESAKSTFDRETFISRFAEILTNAAPERGPALFVIDTFEEIQFFGDELVLGFFLFLNSLQQSAPQLRIVVAGRATSEHFAGNELELGDFDKAISRKYLKKKLAYHNVDDADGSLAERMISAVGGNPLCLNLGARLVAQAGPSELGDIRTRSAFFRQLKAEKIQAQLYIRILGHIHSKDKLVEKLAHPGLIVRRIDGEVIRKVLAGPCKLNLKKGQEEKLMRTLEKEVALLSRDYSDNSLRHRTDVRRMMLPLILEEYPEVAAKIDKKAVKHYKKKSGAIARAEEIYHRLRLKQAVHLIERRWRSDVASLLMNAIEELEPDQRVYLSQKLGITPKESLLKLTNLAIWERITAQKVHRLHQSGAIDQALIALRERHDRSPSSLLFELECETLRQLQSFEEALAVVQRGLDSAIDAGDRRLEVAMYRQSSLCHEGLGRLEPALKDIRAAKRALAEKDDIVDRLRIAVATVRLTRKSGLTLEHKARVQEIWNLALPNLNRLSKHPVLLRELIAELGGKNLDILKLGIEALGVEVLNDQHANALARTLAHWDANAVASEGGRTISSTAKLSNDASSEEQWNKWIRKNVGMRLNRTLLTALNEFDIDKTDQIGLANHFQSAVEVSVMGNLTSAAGTVTKKTIA